VAPTTVQAPVGARDLSQVPCTFIDRDDRLDELDVLVDAVLVALDTETVFDPENPTDLDTDGPGAWRVLSMSARLSDASVRSFVLDMGYVSAGAVQSKLNQLALARFRRAHSAGVTLPASILELIELGELDALDVLGSASGQLRFDLIDARHAAGVEAVVWNANFDRFVLARDGVDAWFLRDAMLYRAVLDLGRAGVQFYTSLARAAREALGVDLDGKGSTQLSYREPEIQPVLSDEQVRYAAHDAVVTLELFDKLAAEVADAGLSETVELEVRAQEFISSLTRKGLPLDVAGWREHLAGIDRAQAAVEVRLAGLTGSQTDLFGELSLGWSPSKDADIRRVLNEHASDRVRAYFASMPDGSSSGDRLLGRSDSVDKTALGRIGGELAGGILEWKKLDKIRSTYGSELVELADASGRLHPRYLQAVVATGRLASSRPNAQNLSPQMKPFLRPPDGRVFVYADLGQAELRMLAQVSGDEVLRQAFRDGADIHTRTAEGMFKLDVPRLMGAAGLSDEELVAAATELVSRGLLRLTGELSGELSDSDVDGGAADRVCVVDGRRYLVADLAGQLAKYAASLRARGKTLNFGVCYGLRANSLAQQLSVAGVPTDRKEANRLLELYDKAYPGVAAWLRDRDAFIAQLAAQPPTVSFERSLELLDWHPKVLKVEKQLKKELGRRPDGVEIVQVLFPSSEVADRVAERLRAEGREVPGAGLDELVGAEFARRAEWVDEVRTHLTPVLVGIDGAPVAFESRTPGGRRRIFNIRASAWVKEMAMIAIRSGKDAPVALRHRFEEQHNVVLSDPKDPKRTVAFGELNKRLTPTLARAYFDMIRSEMPDAVGYLYQTAVSEAFKALGNQYRNAPIQGGVADAALWAYARIQQHLVAFFPSAHGVQTVHDSITIECDAADALAVGEMLQAAMEAGLARYTPEVPAVADMAILSCLDEKVGAIDPSTLPSRSS
jgi:DNA polymerase I-like protein with 3'-5' exonuclease and polymerase domains